MSMILAIMPLMKLPFHAFLQLSQVKLSRYGEDLLFFLFYMNGGDEMQLKAAAEL